MKLLILTQKVDKNDAVLGFFHNWLLKFSQKFEKVVVICLQKGEYDLPNNVRVLSLGKEKRALRLFYILNFYRYIWQERKNYDAVFSHMNQEYILLGGIVWKLLRKKVTMWRNHQKGDSGTRLAVFLSDKVFCTSPESYTKRFKKTEVMPVGIDTDLFFRDDNIQRSDKSILFLSRISPIKNPDILLRALCILKKRGIDFKASFVGNPLKQHQEFYKGLKNKADACGISDRVEWLPAVPNWQAPEVYNKYEIYVNLTNPGSMDKTIFEAMSCHNLVVSSHPALSKVLPAELSFEYKDSEGLADSLEKSLVMPAEDKVKYQRQFRKYVIENHSLNLLADKLSSIIT